VPFRLQSDYDLDVAADRLGDRLEREVQVSEKAGSHPSAGIRCRYCRCRDVGDMRLVASAVGPAVVLRPLHRRPLRKRTTPSLGDPGAIPLMH